MQLKCTEHECLATAARTPALGKNKAIGLMTPGPSRRSLGKQTLVRSRLDRATQEEGAALVAAVPFSTLVLRSLLVTNGKL